MDGFSEGYEFFVNQSSGVLSGELGHEYINAINQEIENLTTSLNGMKGLTAQVDQLKGNVAEFWTAGTFNIKAAVNGSDNRASVPTSNSFASVDVETSWGENYGLKYYKTGTQSAKQQAKSIFETFKEYQDKGGKDPFDKYCADRGYSDESIRHDPIYSGQMRLIPVEQIQDATNWLKRKIAENIDTRPEQVKRYKETLDLLCSKIEDNKGNQSIELSTADARHLAELAEEGGFDPADFGLTTEELIQFRNIMQQAFKAGLTSAVITLVLKTAPEIMKAIKHLIETGEIDIEQYKKIGIAAATGTAEGFINGALSAAIVSCCKSGLLGTALIVVDPTIVGMVTVVGMIALKNSYKVVKGEMTRYAMTNELVKDLFVGACGIVVGAAAQYVIRIPVLGFMIGNFIGSALGSFAYQAGYSATMSFCIDTGITLFGLVDQNYKLPENVLKEIGIEVFEYETFNYDVFEADRFEYDKFEPDRFDADEIDITFIRRGVIGVSQIGYI